MELITKKKLHLFSGRSQPRRWPRRSPPPRAWSSASPTSREFANGEIHCRFAESIRGADVFIIQTHSAGAR